MQGLTVFCIFFILTLFFLIRTKDFFHPSTIVCLEWLLIVGLYLFTNHGLFKLSNKTYSIIFLWVTLFSFVAYFFSKKNFYIKPKYRIIQANQDFIKKLYSPLLIANIFLIFAIIMAYGFSFSAIRIRMLKYVPIYVKLLFYINTFSYAYFAVICFSKEFSVIKIFIFALFIIITSFFKVNKTTFISFFLLILFVLKERKILNIRNFLLLLCTTSLLLYSIMSLRGDKGTFIDFSLWKYLAIYLLSPLTAFNEVVQQKITIPEHLFGSYCFNFLHKIFALFTDEKIEIFGPWVNVPLPTNVFTVFAPAYIDLGFFGIILLSLIQGYVWGFIYGFVKRNFLIFKVIYGTLLYYLGLQFFSDYFSYSFSVFIQYIVFSIFLVVKITETKYFSFYIANNKSGLKD